MTNPHARPAPSRTSYPGRQRALGLRAASVLFLLLAAALVAGLWLPIELPLPRTGEPTLLFATAALVLIVSLSRQLPLQNILLASLVIGVTGSAVEVLSRWTGFAGARFPARDTGPMLFGLLPLFTPLIWIVALLSSRGVAKLILRPWRSAPDCGLWLLGLTPLLAVVLGVGLETFAIEVRQWWQYAPAAGPRLRQSCPLQTSFGWLLTSGLILCLAMPALIEKSPVRLPPDFGPLVVWTALNLLFACGALSERCWSTAGVIVTVTLAVAWLAQRNGRRELAGCEGPSPPR